ncbi:MAG: M67 family metallopeptidase [Sphingomonadales bacterium]|nr:M67 family metallopeptidase [Sphingomonadales bacterium]
MAIEIAVTRGVIATLLAEARAAAPGECCGLLLGEGEQITRSLPCANVHRSPERFFEIDPAALVAAHRTARNGGPRLLGYYHSHPRGDPRPSAEDRRNASGDGRIWAIIATGAVRFYRDADSGFVALTCHLCAE